MDTSKRYTKGQAISVLLMYDVVKCEIDYSGGNDEGGVDSIKVTYADGREELNPSWCQRTYAAMVPNPDTGKWERKTLTREQMYANQAADIIEHPVYDRYYSFAGEYYVHGTLVYDVPEGKAYMDGVEEVPAESRVLEEL